MMHKQWAEETMERIISKLKKTAPQIGARFPHISEGKEFSEELSDFWTNGFWPGILWIAYQQTGNEEFAEIAKKVEEKMDEVLDGYDGIYHDAGFMWLLSSGANYKITGNDTSRRRLMKAASFLASRFNLKGNFIRAWNTQPGWAIIDCSMNLPLLYWASNEINDPRFKYVAQAHAETVLKHFIRDDGSVNHIVSFDPVSGEFLEVLAGQGMAPDSAWSRGASWALYGMALAYRHLGDKKYLDAAKKVANFFIANLPEDLLAHWDFRVKKEKNTPRDASATACAVCGLLEIADHVEGAEGDNYREKAYRILRSLTDNFSNLDNDEDQAILKLSTVYAVDNYGVNVGLIYADYFYIEAISRLMGSKEIFWHSEPKTGNA